MRLIPFKSGVLILMSVTTFALLPPIASAQVSGVSQSCAQLGFKPGSQGHTNCVNQNSGAGGNKAAPKPAAKAPVLVIPELTAAQREDKFWDDAKAIGNKEAYQGYLNSYPVGRYADLAKANLASLVAAVAQREDKFWEDVKGVGDTQSYQSYLDSYPRGRYVSLAKGKMPLIEPST